VRRPPGRLILDLESDADLPRLRERVATVFGIAYFAPALSIPPDWATVQAAVLQLLEGRSFESFRITARRTFKVFPMPSDEINRELGALVLRHFPTRVNLSEPALTVRVDLLPGEAFVFVDRVAGPGGLPVGVSGRVTALLSGGIDSPVAACRLQKRGCEVEFVHFHSFPYLADTSQRKARMLVETRKDAIVIPTVAIQHGPAPSPLGTYVYVVGQDKTAKMQPVTIALTTGEVAVIGQGLAGGEHVIIEGQNQVRPGGRVEPSNPNPGPTSAPAGGSVDAARDRRGQPEVRPAAGQSRPRDPATGPTASTQVPAAP
jgi:hypothetical protein